MSGVSDKSLICGFAFLCDGINPDPSWDLGQRTDVTSWAGASSTTLFNTHYEDIYMEKE